MNVDQIAKLIELAKKFSFQFAVLAILSISLLGYFLARWEKILDHEKELYQKEVVLKQKEIELSAKLKKDEAFYEALKDFRTQYGSVDLSTVIECDTKYMDRYREATTSLNALDGMARETGKYRSYEKFFDEKRGMIRGFISRCGKKES